MVASVRLRSVSWGGAPTDSLPNTDPMMLVYDIVGVLAVYSCCRCGFYDHCFCVLVIRHRAKIGSKLVVHAVLCVSQ